MWLCLQPGLRWGCTELQWECFMHVLRHALCAGLAGQGCSGAIGGQLPATTCWIRRRRCAVVNGALLQTYLQAKIKQFARAFSARLALNLQPAQLDALVSETLMQLASQEMSTARSLRLVVRHDCQ